MEDGNLERRLRIGIDIGGTFTDFVAVDSVTGDIRVDKCLTTPDNPAIGVTVGLLRFLQRIQRSAGEIHTVVHGTTLVANTLIERKGARTGLITTRGFRDIPEIGNEIRYDLYDLNLVPPEPLAPRPLRLEVDERLGHDGAVHTPLDPQQVEGVARQLRDAGVESIAVCFLHSFRNPAHEEAVLQWLSAHWPEVDVSLSSRVSPEIREFPRMSTTLANAYVRPLMRRYLRQLERDLRGLGMAGSFYAMLSSGGITGVEDAQEVPIRLVESGPAGGAQAAVFYGTMTGERDLLSFDMGGTTAKICLIVDGQPSRSTSFEAARVQRFKKGSGLPLNVPVLEMIEIGAGGGSIAGVNALGLLQVGPRSAGSAPGPACYGLGGDRPTVTDADLILGYLDPNYFLGGEIPLYPDRAREAVVAHVGQPLHLDATAGAAAICAVVNTNMASAAAVHIAERGFDPRRFTLIAFGGAGPVHGYSVAASLGIRTMLVPLAAGTTSALGFLAAPLAVELGRSYMERLSRVDWQRANAIFTDMEEAGRRTILAAGGRAEEIRITRTADMRYISQGYEIEVPLPGGHLAPAATALADAAFHEEYRRLYGRSLDVPVEILSWRVRVAAPAPRVRLAFQPAGRDPLKGRRPVYFAEAGGFVDCPVYDRYAMRPGAEVEGPAIFEERESTSMVGPGARVQVDADLTLHVKVGVQAAATPAPHAGPRRARDQRSVS
ncbi:MAG: hydantoinase/oxoprolinase family protein [Armatimonadetes bacterium]|nr:hydantoinase/oxoprolinase family protein [Armatimonadota bacterium]